MTIFPWRRVRQNYRKLYLTKLHAHVVRKDIGWMKRIPFKSLLALGQGAMYVFTGIWPLVSRRSFEKVTGPKMDFWLVKTVGIVITVIGSALMLAGVRRKSTPEISLLAVGSAAGLTAVDLGYVAKNRISPVYLLDAVIEMGLLALWTIALARE